MIIPKFIKIGGSQIEVELTSETLENKDNIGLYDPHSDKIFLKDSLKPDRKEETLLHEIVECINEKFDYNLSHKTISGIAVNLHQILKDNPDLNFS